MSKFKGITGGRYGMHSGSAKFKSMEVVNNLWVQGNSFPATMIPGDIFYVDMTVTTSGDGKSWGTAFKTVTEAVTAAGDYDAILIGPGVYSEAATIAITQDYLKIFGAGTSGFIWGPTSLKSDTCADHLMSINSIGVEVAGLDFIANTTSKNSIQMSDTTTTYKTHIHDCHFGGGGTTNIGINCDTTQDTVDIHVERCEFYNHSTAGIFFSSTRGKITDCLFFVPAAGVGIDLTTDTGDNRPDKLIANNMIIGSNSTDTGIKIASTEPSKGSLLVYNNCVTYCSVNITQDKSEEGCVNNPTFLNGTAPAQVDMQAA